LNLLNSNGIYHDKLEIIFTPQVGTCILGSSVPANTPVYAQAANSLEDQFKTGGAFLGAGDLGTAATVADIHHLPFCIYHGIYFRWYIPLLGWYRP
jgi:hypothetical protein